MKREIIYLAAPYTHTDKAVREERYEKVTRAAATLIKKGNVVFSPLTMTHPIDKILSEGDATLGSEYWVDFDESFMSFCDRIIVLKLDGWEQSSGVAREICFFKSRGIEAEYLEEQT